MFNTLQLKSHLSKVYSNPNVTVLHISLKFVGLLAGIIYFDTEINQAGISNLSGAIFFLLTSITFNNISSVIFVSNSAFN